MSTTTTLQGVEILPPEGELENVEPTRAIMTTLDWLGDGLLFESEERTTGLKAILFLLSAMNIHADHDDLLKKIRLGMNKSAEEDEALFILFQRATINIYGQKRFAEDNIREYTQQQVEAERRQKALKDKEIELSRREQELAQREEALTEKETDLNRREQVLIEAEKRKKPGKKKPSDQ